MNNFHLNISRRFSRPLWRRECLTTKFKQSSGSERNNTSHEKWPWYKTTALAKIEASLTFAVFGRLMRNHRRNLLSASHDQWWRMWTAFKSTTTYNSIESKYHKFKWIKQPHQHRANYWQSSTLMPQWISTAEHLPARTIYIRGNYLSNRWLRGTQLRVRDDLFFAKKIYSS